MGTKKTTTTTNQYDPTSMGAFQGLTKSWAPLAQSFMQNPFGSPQFGLEQQMGTRQAANLGQTGMSNLLRNQIASGFGGGATNPFMQEMMANQARANTGLTAQMGFIQPTMNALQRQQYAMGLGAGYQPLQTGQQQVQKTSGLGTWLPQVAGMGLGALTGGLGLIPGLAGGMGGVLGGLGGAMGIPGLGGGGGATSGSFAGSPGSMGLYNNLLGSNNAFIGGMNTSMSGGYGPGYGNWLTPPGGGQ